MANKHKGEVALPAGDKTYTLLYSINALCELESAVEDVFAAIADLSSGRPKRRLTLLRAVCHVGLLDKHPDLTLRDVGDIIGEAGIDVASQRVSEALILAFPKPEGDGPLDGASRPPTG